METRVGTQNKEREEKNTHTRSYGTNRKIRRDRETMGQTYGQSVEKNLTDRQNGKFNEKKN